MKDGDGKHLTVLHLYTDYKITYKPIKEMTAVQYCAILAITEQIMKFKTKNKPFVVI